MKKSKEQILEEFENTSTCIYTFKLAYEALQNLSEYCSLYQIELLEKGWKSFSSGNGSGEVFSACRTIREDWRHE